MPEIHGPETAIPESEQSAIAALAGSSSFRKAPVLRDLLLYLWEHREAALSEYAIGTEVLGRKADFDPKTDSAVRVHISRLRARLKEHYEANPSPVRVSIPPGEYRLELQRVAEAERPVEAAPAAAPTRREFPWRLAAAGTAVTALLFDNVRLRMGSRPEAPALDAFWLQFLQKGRPQNLIVPAPMFFRFQEQPFLARDFRVNRPEEVTESAYLQELRSKYGPMEESRLYTIASDTLAASAVSRYLEDRGTPAVVLDTPSAGLDLLASQDAIFFVGPGTSAQIPDIMKRLGYGFQQSTAGTNRGIADRRDPAVTFPITNHSPARSTGYGVIALLPGKGAGTHVLVVASSFNPALASVLTLPTELEQLRKFLAQQQTGKYFEAVIRYERNGDKVLDARPVAARALTL